MNYRLSPSAPTRYLKPYGSLPEALRGAGIYAIINEQAGMVYVGNTREFIQRWRGHQYRLRAGKHATLLLQQHWNEQGIDAFVFVILEALDQRAQNFRAREKHYAQSLGLALYNPLVFR